MLLSDAFGPVRKCMQRMGILTVFPPRGGPSIYATVNSGPSELSTEINEDINTKIDPLSYKELTDQLVCHYAASLL